MFAEVCDLALVQNSQPRVPCHSDCAHFVHVLCAHLSILMAVLIICCASPPAWLLARLSARGGARFCRPCGSWHPARSLRCHTWSPTGLVGFPVDMGLLVPVGHHVLLKTNWYLHLRLPRALRLQLQLCAGPVHGRVPRGSLLCGGCPALEGSPSASWSSARPSFPCAHPRFSSP